MINVIELFAGIGSQTQALKNQNIKHKIVGISEWSINSIISYGEIHGDNKTYNLNKDEILKELKNITFSLDTKNPKDISKLKEDKLKLLYKNHKNSKNLGSIIDIKGYNLPEHDLLTYSFPCIDISNQGKQKGLYEGKSSSLLWQVGRLLDEVKKLPRFLLMENVAAILNDKHKEGLEKWMNFLKNKGYYNYLFKLKASYYNVPQNRERVFMVSSLIEISDLEKNIRKNEKMTNLRIRDILEGEHKILKNLYQYLPDNIKFKTTNNNIKSIILDKYTSFISESKIYNIDSISPTITSTGANSRIKVLDDNKNILELNSLELWKLMGFTKTEYNKVKNLHSENELKKQAGNSIVVTVLEEIFKNIPF